MEKMFMRVDEVMEALEVSESYAYKLIKRLNRELEANLQIVPQRESRRFLMEYTSFTAHKYIGPP